MGLALLDEATTILYDRLLPYSATQAKSNNVSITWIRIVKEGTVIARQALASGSRIDFHL
jgi:hypothetical protein